MAEPQPDKSEKTEPPSSYKLSEAKKKGGVYKSMEITHVVVLLGGVVLLWSLAPDLASRFLRVCYRLFDASGSIPINVQNILSWSQWVGKEVIGILSPLFVTTIVAGVLAVLLQIGPVFTFHPIKPDIKRINPIEGFKRLFSVKILFELGKNLFKLIMLGFIVYWCVGDLLPEFFGLLQTTPTSAIPFVSSKIAELIFKLAIALSLIAIIDFLFVRKEFLKNMRMTKKEVKDEMKRREGDPMVRAKRRELERELRKRAKSVSSLSDADVVITNPDHFAVVIKYDAGNMVAPKIVGKGIDAMALHLKAQARQLGVVVVADPPLARFLYRKVNIGNAIPEVSYIGVARAIRKAHRIKNTEFQAASKSGSYS